MLASSHHYAEIKHFEDHGIELTGEVKVNLKNGCSQASRC
jgi:dihydrolipoamide dehydrogenase